MASEIGEPKLEISRKEVEVELKRLREFCVKHGEHEIGILACAEMLSSAAKAHKPDSDQKLALEKERETLLAGALKNPGASIKIARQYGYALSSKASQVTRLDAKVGESLDAIIAELVKLEEQFPGNFESAVKRMESRKQRYREYQARRRK